MWPGPRQETCSPPSIEAKGLKAVAEAGDMGCLCSGGLLKMDWLSLLLELNTWNPILSDLVI